MSDRESFVAAAAAELDEAVRDAAVDELLAFTQTMTDAHAAMARGVRVAPYWRDPAHALRVESMRRGGPAAVLFEASARSWDLRAQCEELERQLP